MKDKDLKDVKESIRAEKSGEGLSSAYDYKISKIPLTVNPTNIEQAYIGKPQRCMCGCSGKYYSSSKGKGTDWYFKAYPEQINIRKVQKILNKMRKHPQDYEVVDDHIITKVIGGTQYTIYLTEK